MLIETIVELVAVTIVKNNVVDALWIYPNSESAEERFLLECSKRINNWAGYTPDDVDTILDNGYEEFENGSICITHQFPEDY